MLSIHSVQTFITKESIPDTISIRISIYKIIRILKIKIYQRKTKTEQDKHRAGSFQEQARQVELSQQEPSFAVKL